MHQEPKVDLCLYHFMDSTFGVHCCKRLARHCNGEHRCDCPSGHTAGCKHARYTFGSVGFSAQDADGTRAMRDEGLLA